MKAKRITIAPATPPECPAWTTPSRCKSPAWKARKGPNCVGRADGKDDCDCLDACGDDPGLKNGRALPCAKFLARQAQAAAHQQTQADLRRFLDAAAGEGLELAGVDAADLFSALYPPAAAGRPA